MSLLETNYLRILRFAMKHRNREFTVVEYINEHGLGIGHGRSTIYNDFMHLQEEKLLSYRYEDVARRGKVQYIKITNVGIKEYYNLLNWLQQGLMEIPECN